MATAYGGPPLSISAQCFETWDMTLDMEARRRCEYACEAMSATARGDFLANDGAEKAGVLYACALIGG